MRILALEFSSSRRSVALAVTTLSGPPDVTMTEAAEGRHTPSAAMIHEVLKRTGTPPGQVSRVAVGIGPGSYTGIRHALAVAQGWQLAHGIPVTGISSAEVLAEVWRTQGQRGSVGILIDAQREEHWMTRFALDDVSARSTSPGVLIGNAALRALQAEGLPLGGTPSPTPPESLHVLEPGADILALLAVGREGTRQAETLIPAYVRPAAFVKAPPPRKWESP